MFAAATLSIGAKIAKRGSLLAAGLLLDPRQRDAYRFAEWTRLPFNWLIGSATSAG
jgi:hypothetical protein